MLLPLSKLALYTAVYIYISTAAALEFIRSILEPASTNGRKAGPVSLSGVVRVRAACCSCQLAERLTCFSGMSVVLNAVSGVQVSHRKQREQQQWLGEQPSMRVFSYDATSTASSVRAPRDGCEKKRSGMMLLWVLIYYLQVCILGEEKENRNRILLC